MPRLLAVGRRGEPNVADALQAEAVELQSIVAAMAEGVVVLDESGRVLRANPAARRILGGLDGDDGVALSRGRWESADGEPVAPEQLPAARALRGEEVRGEVLARPLPDGERTWVSASAVPVRDDAGHVRRVIATFADISAWRRLQEEREDLVRMIGHDLRTPLAVVRAQAEAMRRWPERVDRVPDRLASILRSCDRMSRMIRDVVDLVLVDDGHLALVVEPIDLAAFGAELRQRLAGAVDAARIVVEVPAELPPVLADADRLERILVNLLTNALKYASSEVRVRAREVPGGVEITVADRGPGIPREALPRLFDRFFRARNARAKEGLGLGLYVTRRLVEAHGGTIAVESVPGHGTTFRVLLPAEDVTPPAAA